MFGLYGRTQVDQCSVKSDVGGRIAGRAGWKELRQEGRSVRNEGNVRKGGTEDMSICGAEYVEDPVSVGLDKDRQCASGFANEGLDRGRWCITGSITSKGEAGKDFLVKVGSEGRRHSCGLGWMTGCEDLSLKPTYRKRAPGNGDRARFLDR